MKAKKKLIVFNIDGTITQSTGAHYEAFTESLRKFGIGYVNDYWKGYKYLTDHFIFRACYETYFDRNMEAGVLAEFEEVLVEQMLGKEIAPVDSQIAEFVQYAWSETEYGVVYCTDSLVKPAIIKLVEASIPFTNELVIGSNQHQNQADVVNQAIDTAKNYYGVSSFEEVSMMGEHLWKLIIREEEMMKSKDGYYQWTESPNMELKALKQ